LSDLIPEFEGVSPVEIAADLFDKVGHAIGSAMVWYAGEDNAGLSVSAESARRNSSTSMLHEGSEASEQKSRAEIRGAVTDEQRYHTQISRFGS